MSTSMTPWTAACKPSLSFTNSRSLLKLISSESVMPSNHLILCHSVLLLPSIFPSIRVFSNELTLHNRWPKYWSFSFLISLPMNIQDWLPLGLTGLISFLPKGLSRVFSNSIVLILVVDLFYALDQVENVPLYSHILSFCYTLLLTFIICFFTIYWDDHMVCSFSLLIWQNALTDGLT